MADYVGPTTEQLQDLLLENSGFADFLLGLTTISASLLGSPDPMLCAITVEREASPATVASSSDTARRLDEKQYIFDDGPCLTALRSHRTVLIKDLSSDDDWRGYANRIAGEGVRSVLAVPIESEEASPAALNCYALTLGFSTKQQLPPSKPMPYRSPKPFAWLSVCMYIRTSRKDFNRPFIPGQWWTPPCP